MTQIELAFDSPEWRQIRNDKVREWIGNDAACSWFLDFCHVCEIFDDVADQDKPISKADLTTALFASLVEMPSNQFFAAHRQVLSGVIITGINAWLDANELEATEYADEVKYVEREDTIKAFMLRDWYMELLAIVIYLTRGPIAMREISPVARKFFQAETFLEYATKLRDRAQTTGAATAPSLMEAAE